MSFASDSQSGKLYRLRWRPEMGEAWPIRGRECLDRARLVVVSPEIPAAAARQVPDATPVVHLPSGPSAPREAAVGLARRTVAEGETVVWLQAADAATGPRSDGPDDVDVDELRSFRDQRIDGEELPPDGPSGSLMGNWVLLARPRHQVADSVDHLKTLGCAVVSQPAIVIGPPTDWRPVDTAIDRLESHDWLVFSSANGVRFLLDRLWDRQGDLRRLAGVKLAAIGPGTAEALGRYRLRPDVVPDEHRAEALAEALLAEASGRRFLLARASRGREVLAERLSAAGADVEQIVVYESTDLSTDQRRLRPVLRLLDEGRIDWLVVSSSAIARSVVRLFGRRLEKTREASISPVTSEVLRELGHPPAVEAKTYTLEGVVEAILAH